MKARPPVEEVHIVGMFQLQPGWIFMVLRPSENWAIVPPHWRRQLTITVNGN